MNRRKFLKTAASFAASASFALPALGKANPKTSEGNTITKPEKNFILADVPRIENTECPDIFTDALRIAISYENEELLRFDRPIWAHACFHVGWTVGASHADPKYFGRGIGTAMLRKSVQWAREHDYAGVIGHGGTKVAPGYNVWMGCLPWTTYASMGFKCVAIEEGGKQLPWWTKNEEQPELMAQVDEAIAAGRGYDELCARLMLLRF